MLPLATCQQTVQALALWRIQGVLQILFKPVHGKATHRVHLAAMFHIVLHQPEIPPNTGNIIRLAANTGCTLHLIEPLGFTMEDAQLRRAGLDYHEYARVQRHANWQAFLQQAQPDPQRLFALTTQGQRQLYEASFASGDWLLFGCETTGLPLTVRQACLPGNHLRLPMLPGQRSLNLSNAVAVSVFEAWRQQGFAGAI